MDNLLTAEEVAKILMSHPLDEFVRHSDGSRPRFPSALPEWRSLPARDRTIHRG